MQRKTGENGLEFDVDAMPCANETDAVTLTKVMFREDKVVSLVYKNNLRYTVHADGTKIITSEDESEVVIEKEGFPLTRVVLTDD